LNMVKHNIRFTSWTIILYVCIGHHRQLESKRRNWCPDVETIFAEYTWKASWSTLLFCSSYLLNSTTVFRYPPVLLGPAHRSCSAPICSRCPSNHETCQSQHRPSGVAYCSRYRHRSLLIGWLIDLGFLFLDSNKGWLDEIDNKFACVRELVRYDRKKSLLAEWQ
jgi:hypothetical protein